VAVSDAVLRSLPLPTHDGDADKEDRGRILVVGGSAQTPGAAMLAGLAALRVGAGKLQVATAASVAVALAIALPEAMVIGLPETAEGCIAGKAVDEIVELASQASALVIGPGLLGHDEVAEIVGALDSLPGDVAVVVDAAALLPMADNPRLLAGRSRAAILTPNAGELATMLGLDSPPSRQELLSVVPDAAATFDAVVAVEGRISGPGSALYVDDFGDVGLATSGSGDVLAGTTAGLCARGADPLTAAVVGGHLHGAAGGRLARSHGRIGYLARELLDELPRSLATLPA
jgi:hydroxyethylthiazole kinase-like uncharacterized protein yjeF